MGVQVENSCLHHEIIVIYSSHFLLSLKCTAELNKTPHIALTRLCGHSSYDTRLVVIVYVGAVDGLNLCEFDQGIICHH